MNWDLGPQGTLALFHEQLSEVVGSNVQMVPIMLSDHFQSAASLAALVKDMVEEGRGMSRVEHTMLAVRGRDWGGGDTVAEPRGGSGACEARQGAASLVPCDGCLVSVWLVPFNLLGLHRACYLACTELATCPANSVCSVCRDMSRGTCSVACAKH